LPQQVMVMGWLAVLAAHALAMAMGLLTVQPQ
jgi:hypothetical protein